MSLRHRRQLSTQLSWQFKAYRSSREGATQTLVCPRDAVQGPRRATRMRQPKAASYPSPMQHIGTASFGCALSRLEI